MLRKLSALLVVLCVMAGLTGCFSGMPGMQTISYDHSGPVEALSISQVVCDVTLTVSEDQDIHVEIRDLADIDQQVGVDGSGILTIRAEEDPPRAWLFNLTSEHERSVTVALPAGSYAWMDITTVSGDVRIPADFSVDGIVSLTTVSGDIECAMPSCASLKHASVSGELDVAGTSCQVLQSETTSGDIELEIVTVSESLKIDTVSAEAELTDCSAKSVEIHTTSGEVEFEKLDAEDIEIETVSGDVSGSLAKAMSCTADTVSGKVSIPSDGKEGSCRVTTMSGNIRLTNPQK